MVARFLEGQHVAVSARTIEDMQLKPRRVSTGTFCGGNHPEHIEYSSELVDGVEIPSGQSGPRCFRPGCPDDASVLAREQRQAAGLHKG
jgi:hypothetical protein